MGRQDLRGWWGRIQAVPLAVLLLLLQVQPVAAGGLERAMLGKSQVVDLTQVQIESAAAGGVQEPARFEEAGENDRNSAAQRVPVAGKLATILQLPASVLKGKPTVAQISARDLLAHAVMVDVAPQVAQVADYHVTAEDLRAWERRNGRIPKDSMVLLHTGWARRWNGSDPTRYLNLDPEGVPRVPGISTGATAFLVNERDIRGVGLDTWAPEATAGVAGAEDGMRPLLYAGKWQLLNLTNLERLPAKGVKLVIAPLRVESGSAPARVIAILP